MAQTFYKQLNMLNGRMVVRGTMPGSIRVRSNVKLIVLSRKIGTARRGGESTRDYIMGH